MGILINKISINREGNKLTQDEKNHQPIEALTGAGIAWNDD